MAAAPVRSAMSGVTKRGRFGTSCSLQWIGGSYATVHGDRPWRNSAESDTHRTARTVFGLGASVDIPIRSSPPRSLSRLPKSRGRLAKRAEIRSGPCWI